MPNAKNGDNRLRGVVEVDQSGGWAEMKAEGGVACCLLLALLLHSLSWFSLPVYVRSRIR